MVRCTSSASSSSSNKHLLVNIKTTDKKRRRRRRKWKNEESEIYVSTVSRSRAEQSKAEDVIILFHVSSSTFGNAAAAAEYDDGWLVGWLVGC